MLQIFPKSDNTPNFCSCSALFEKKRVSISDIEISVDQDGNESTTRCCSTRESSQESWTYSQSWTCEQDSAATGQRPKSRMPSGRDRNKRHSQRLQDFLAANAAYHPQERQHPKFWELQHTF
ncbi:unnamed protein product [Polarella glacialis]|uniref:Uncharacterized protein n=1 Tax=Polarella glacialis TaxID=89957 RepID=A0A813K3M7_POLGL|nr:unnamed protein product [Polarella glacialis]